MVMLWGGCNLTTLKVGYDTYNAGPRAINQEERGSKARLGVSYSRWPMIVVQKQSVRIVYGVVEAAEVRFNESYALLSELITRRKYHSQQVMSPESSTQLSGDS